ncbi:acetyltransferase [Mucilaginibacter boryungensis]|uniref:Acetyltransferase n=1 Tax=Mucilaginibacter boryungensis TaxID=768480 RepID=A0ABR9XF54_9SPHI|nr:acetyltransferase [Mucilaginibacter boryungensis]MBE9665846.1 acetyltransferase [Mucilaginibacter boryungensis]
MTKYGIYGAGALGQEVFLNVTDILKQQGKEWDFIGFIDDSLPQGTVVKYGKVAGNIHFLNAVAYKLEIIIAIGNTIAIQNIYQKIDNPKISFPNIIHPSVSYLNKDSVTMGKGNVIGMLGLVSFDVNIGDFNIFNTRVSIGHHVQIGSFNIFHPNIQISGNVKIGDSNTFGFNSGIIPAKKIGNKNTFGPGCIVTRNIANDSLYIGNPAQKFNFNT